MTPHAIRLLFLAIALAALAQPSSLQAQSAKRPNLVVILSDDQGYGDLGLHGNPHLKTPNLDRLATNHIQFRYFYVSPLCAPTRASFLTGRYSLRTGVKGVSKGEETMRSEETTLAEVLRDAGYHTAIFGKWHNGENYPYTPKGQGFDESFGFNLGHWNNYFDTGLKRNGKPVKTKGYITDVLTDEALRFIETNQTRPFFCYLAYNVPHTPLQVPDKYFNDYKAQGLDDRLAAIYGMCANMDANVGRVLDKLDQLKLRENTIVLFFSDNGPHGERYNAGLRGLKGTLHEGGSRVPCFLSWPARFKNPRIIDPVAAHIDLYPTLLELCGVPVPNKPMLDGHSLVPLLEGNSTNWPDRTLFCQHAAGQKALKTGALRTDRYRLVNDGRGWQLYDIQKDPGQTRDLSDKAPELKRRLISDYQAWWQKVLPDASLPVPPISVGYPEENPVTLSVPQSRFDYGLRFNGKHPNNGWLNNWTNTAATIEWQIDIVRPGTYEVTLDFLCPSTDAGSHIRVSIPNGPFTEAVVPATPYRQLPSPDRVPRDEVYEMDWATLKTGTLKLPAGKSRLLLQATSKPHHQVMELKAVSLRFAK